MYRLLAAERRAGKLAAPVRDHLVDIHVELSAATGHPYVQRKHVVMFLGEDFVAYPRDSLAGGLVNSAAGAVGQSRCTFQYRVRRDHLAWHQVPANTEMLERALRLCAPKFVHGHRYGTEAVGLESG